MFENKNITENKNGGKPISRKEALEKTGKYAAFTAAAMMLILEPVLGDEQPPKKSPIKPRTQKTKSEQKRNTPPPSF